MGRVALADIDRPGLLVELANRGIAAGSFGGTMPDVVLAGLSTSDRLAHWRRHWPGPLMIILPGHGEAAAVAALDAGADDALTADVGDALVAARLAALLRRTGGPALIEIGSLRIDTVDRRVTRAGKVIDLLPREYRLLLHFARHAGQCFDRRELLRQVWGLRNDPGTNVVEVHVSRLRARLDRGFAVPMLVTDKGCGYRLLPDNVDRENAIAANVNQG